jgi:hypothetical protein
MSSPIQLAGLSAGADRDLPAIHQQGAARGFHRLPQRPEGAVEAQQSGDRWRVDQVVDRDYLQIRTAQRVTQVVPADPAHSVDAHSDRHC